MYFVCRNFAWRKNYVKIVHNNDKHTHNLLTSRHKLYKLYLKLQQFTYANGEKKGEITS